MNDNQRPDFFHFKNGLFNGYTKDERPEGEAICIYDNGAIFIGHYHASQPDGKCLILLGPQIYYMGELRKGMLEGPFVVRSPQYHIYSRTAMNKVQGQIVVIDRKNKKARVWQIENSEGTCIRQGQYDDFLPEQKILRAISPYTMMFPSLYQYLTDNRFARFMQRKNKNKLQIYINPKYTKRLVVQFQKERLTAAGVTQDGQICGLGYVYDDTQGIELEGEIYNGVIDGQGLKREVTTGKSIFGKFFKGDIRSLQAMDLKGESIQSILVRLKKKIHLHSLQFNNNYLNERPVYLIRNFYQSIVENEVSYNKFIRSEKGSKKNIPLKLNHGMQTPVKRNVQDEFANNIKEFNSIKNALSSSKK